jgi:hypothetical protein
MILAKMLFISGVLFLTIALSCKSTQPLGPEQPDKISYGSYGGFAGAYQEFVLLKDGSVYEKAKFKEEYSLMESISTEATGQFFNLMSGFSSTMPEIHQPGNMTYFIRFGAKGMDSKEWVWGGPNAQPPQSIKILHRNLMSLSKKKAVVM